MGSKEVTMAGRKIRDAADARSCLRAAKAARGVSRAEWARANGIDGRSLHAWQMNLEAGTRSRPQRTARRRSTPAVRMVELVPAPTAAAAGCRVRCGEYTLEVAEGVDDATLRRLLRALREC